MYLYRLYREVKNEKIRLKNGQGYFFSVKVIVKRQRFRKHANLCVGFYLPYVQSVLAKHYICLNLLYMYLSLPLQYIQI